MDGNRPLILIDVDGVLNVTATAAVRRRRCFHDGWKQVRVPAGGYDYRIFCNPVNGPLLRKLAEETGAELAWATMWEEHASLGIGPLLGLPLMPAAPVREPADGSYLETGIKWRLKADSVVPWTAGRPFVWFEDEAEEAERAAELAGDQPYLVILIDECEGLTEAHITMARNWLLAGPGKTTERRTQMSQEAAELKPVEGFAIGDTVEHRLVPGYRMPVQDRKPCETDAIHPAEHPSYLVRDPQGEETWVCHYDVQTPGAGLQWGVPE